MRLLHYYRGEETTLHIRRPAPQLAKHLRALPDPNGPLTIMVTPMPLAFQGRVPHTAHPLLIYSELLAAPDERAKSAAERVRREFLEKSR
jgi:hypothetical protein